MNEELPDPRHRASELRLRKVHDTDIDIFFAQQNEEDGRQMAAFVRAEFQDEYGFRAHWARIRQDSSVHVCTILAEGRVVGSVLSYESDGQPEVSYWLGQEFWGQGMATSALQRFLRDVDPRRPMFARVAADNRPSLRVLEKCGFVPVEQCRGFAEARGREIEEWTLRLD